MILLIECLRAIGQQTLRRPVTPDDDLFNKGLNANRALNIIRGFWFETGIELDVNTFYVHRNVRAIIGAIETKQPLTPAKIFRLRDGDDRRPLFLYAGGVSCFLEMQDVIDSLKFGGTVYGICLTDFGAGEQNVATVADEVDASLAVIRDIDPHGPYRLAGYSFGGVFALELARRLKAGGKEIALLAMIDSPQNDHSWRWKDWSGLMCRILIRQLQNRLQARRGAQAPEPEQAVPRYFDHSPARRGHQLFFRFRNPKNPDYPIYAPQWAGGYTPHYCHSARQLLRMKGLYRPARFEGDVVFFASRGGSPIDCDAASIWKPYLPRAEWILVGGHHMSMMVGRHSRSIAAILDGKLDC